MNCCTLDRICGFLNSTQGLDKLYRLLSYLSKLFAALLNDQKGFMGPAFAKLSRNFSHTRTVMRLVGLLHNFRTSRDFLSDSLSTPFDWKSFKALTRILTNYTYLPCDHLAWMGREDIVYFHPETIGLFSRTSAQSWLVGLVVEIIDLSQNIRSAIRELNENLRNGHLGFRKSLQEFKTNTRPLLLKATLIAGDFPLAINYSLRVPILSPLVIGLCGTTSSLAALYIRWISFHEGSDSNRHHHKN